MLPGKGLFDLWEGAKGHFTNLTDTIPSASSVQADVWFRDQKGSGTQQDAARHALWNAAMTAQYGAPIAEAISTAYELPGLIGLSGGGAEMDLYNNATGRRIASQMDNWKDVLNAIRTEAELAEKKKAGLFETGPGLIYYPDQYPY